jgi:hypothetical protein
MVGCRSRRPRSPEMTSIPVGLTDSGKVAGRAGNFSARPRRLASKALDSSDAANSEGPRPAGRGPSLFGCLAAIRLLLLVSSALLYRSGGGHLGEPLGLVVDRRTDLA